MFIHTKNVTIPYSKQNEVFFNYISNTFFFLKLYTEVPELLWTPVKQKAGTQLHYSQHLQDLSLKAKVLSATVTPQTISVQNK